MEFFYKVRRTCGLVKVYWHTIDGDWSSLAYIMAYQMKRIADHIREHDIIVDAEKEASDIDETREALEYILHDKSYDEANRIHGGMGGEAWCNTIRELEERNMARFVDGMSRIRNWWD